MGTVSVRDANEADARAIADVHVESWRWAYRGLLPDDLLAALSVDEREVAWLDAIRSDPGSVLVAVGPAVVGFAGVGASRDDDAEAGTGELLSLYVTESVVGTGVGAALLAAAQDRLRERGFTSVTLWVLDTNARGLRFYERHGWAWDGTRSSHQAQCAEQPIVRYVTRL